MMTVTGSYQAVSQDVSDTVKAWLSQAKRRISDPSVKPQEISNLSKGVPSNIADVLTLRSLLSRNNAANRDLQDCSRAMANKLDTIGRSIGLDTVIRDPEDGSVLIPHNQLPNIVISKQREVSQEAGSAVPSRHSGSQPLYAVLDILSVKLPMELLPSTVTGRLQLHFYIFMPSQSSEVKLSSTGLVGTGEITDQFNLIWDRNSAPDQTWQPKQSAVFDLSSFHWTGTPISNRIFLVCVAYRIGAMKPAVLSEESSSRLGGSSSEQFTTNIKRPVGVAVLDLFPSTPVRTETRFHSLRKTRRPSHTSLVDVVNYDEPTNLLSWQDPNGACYTLNFGSNSAATLQELASEAMPSSNTIGAPLNSCQVDLKLTLLTSPPLVCTHAALKSTKAAPLYVEPAGFMNPKINAGQMSKCYVTLLDGMLSRLGSNRKTNAEVSVYCVKLLHGGSGSGTTKSDIQPLYCSSVYDAVDKPIWNEHFDVEIDHEPDTSVHLLFSIRMRSSRVESDKKLERERFFAFVPLTWRSVGGGDCLVATEDKQSIALAFYRLTHHAKDPSTLPTPSSYLNLEWRFEEMSRKYGQNSMANTSLNSSTEHLPSQKSNSSLGNAISAALSPIYASGPAKTISVGDGVEFCARNFVNLEVTFCSAQLTQSEKLAQFLALRQGNVGELINQKADRLADVFMELDTELWIHLLFPCFDKIFELITFAGKTHNQELLDLIFTKCLLSILKTLLRSKAQQDGKTGTFPLKYIQTNFCSPNCFLPLADALNRSLSVKAQVPNPVEVIVICTKFAISSYKQYVQICVKLGRSIPENVVHDFTLKLNDIVRKLAELAVKDPILRQRCFPDVIELVSNDFCDRSKLYQRIISDISSQNWSDKEVLDFFRVLAKGHLGNDEGRRILLPPILATCCHVLDAFSFSSNVNTFSAEFQVAYLALMVLQEVLNAKVGATSTNEQLLPVLRVSLRVACLVSPNNDSHWLAMNVALSCGKLLTFDSLDRYFSGESFAHPLEVVDFINECLISIERLFLKDPEMKQMASFIFMRNSIIANNILAEFGRFVIRKLGSSAHVVACFRQFLHSTLTFLLQPSLEVERFPENFQSQRFADHLGDLRLTAAQVLLDFWTELGKFYKTSCSKVLFQPEASLVQLALSCLPELRHSACLILKDILKLELEVAHSQKRRSTISNQVLETQGCIALFLQSLDYLVIKLPQRIREFHEDFEKVFEKNQSNSSVVEIDYIERQVELLLDTVKKQLLFLDDYIQACTTSPSPVAELTCLRRMILFYQKKELIVPYVTHLSTLYQRQLGRQKFAEAACALEELSALVSWTDEPLPLVVQNLSLVHHQGTQRSFKEALYEKAAELFQEIQLYERAILLYRELMKQHLNYTFDYEKLAQVYECLAALTRLIATILRQPPRFFWVTFIGSHPSILPCLQNTSFIFREPAHQMMSDFAELFKCWFPDVPVRHEPPSILLQNKEKGAPAAIHIVIVEPNSFDAVSQKFPARVPERIVAYYRMNDISQFFHVRTKKHTDGSVKGECFDLECASPMPYMLEWTDVRMEKVQRRELDGIQLAFYDVNKKNVELRAYLDAYQSTRNDAKNPQQDLQRGVKGIVDAPIGGGIFMYTPYFTNSNSSEDFSSQASLKQLHDAILTQFQLASEGMKYLKRVMCVNVPDLRGLYEFMEIQYAKYSQVVGEIKNWQGGADLSRRTVVVTSQATPGSASEQRKNAESVIIGESTPKPPSVRVSVENLALLTPSTSIASSSEGISPISTSNNNNNQQQTNRPPPIPPKPVRRNVVVPQ